MSENSFRSVVSVVLGVAALALIATGAVVLGQRLSSTGEVDQSGYAPPLSLSGVSRGTPFDASVEPDYGSVAASPAEAVRRYLDGEFEGDHVKSFGQLTLADRRAIGTADDWDVTADERPTLRSYRLVEVGRDRVRADVEVVPAVNEIDGVSPAAATIEFAIRHEDGGSRISLTDTTFTPHYPDHILATASAVSWVDAAQQCDADVRSGLEYEGNLLGTFGLAESLCGVTGDPKVSATGSLDSLNDPSVVLNAFGEQAAVWSQVVSIEGVTGVPPLDVVLAPFGDHWVVIGALSSINQTPSGQPIQAGYTGRP